MLCLNTVKHSSTTSDTATHDDEHSGRAVKHDERTVEGNNRSTKTHSSNAQGVVKNQHWVKKGLLLKNAQQIFLATAENWASNRAHKAAHTAHSKQSKRFNALF